MQLHKMISAFAASIMLASVMFGTSVHAAPEAKKKVYDEVSFLKAFSGKSRKQVAAVLGQPIKKEQSVKPSNADSFVASAGKEDKSKRVNVEMWYYANIVTYDGKRTYKSTEMTFVNDRCQNVAFFNNK